MPVWHLPPPPLLPTETTISTTRRRRKRRGRRRGIGFRDPHVCVPYTSIHPSTRRWIWTRHVFPVFALDEFNTEKAIINTDSSPMSKVWRGIAAFLTLDTWGELIVTWLFCFLLHHCSANEGSAQDGWAYTYRKEVVDGFSRSNLQPPLLPRLLSFSFLLPSPSSSSFSPGVF